MSKGLKKAVTKIIEQVRIDLDITRDEYAFCEYVQFRASDPRQKRPGWCTDNRDEIANFVGVSRKGLYKMAKRMEDRNLLEIGAAGDIRVTAKWVDLQAAGKETSQIPAPKNGYLVPKNDGPKPDHNGNLVPKQWELSTQTDGNLVPETIIINVEHDNKHEEREEKPAATSHSLTPVPEFSLPVEAERDSEKNQQRGGGAAAGGPAPAVVSISDRPNAKTPLELEAAMKRFFDSDTWRSEWDEGVVRMSGAWIPDTAEKPARLNSILSEFCRHMIEKNNGGDTYGMLNAAFQKWVSNERHATWKQRSAPATASTAPKSSLPANIRKL